LSTSVYIKVNLNGNISKYYCVYYILDQIHAALVSKNLFKKSYQPKMQKKVECASIK